MRGPAARFAYSAADLVALLDQHTTYELGGYPSRKRRLINGVVIDQDTDARVIRRWRSGRIEGVTKAAAERLLGKVNLTTDTLTPIRGTK